ncbi:hypothetical protein D3C86_1642850 [compost metagenome]
METVIGQHGVDSMKVRALHHPDPEVVIHGVSKAQVDVGPVLALHRFQQVPTEEDGGLSRDRVRDPILQQVEPSTLGVDGPVERIARGIRPEAIPHDHLLLSRGQLFSDTVEDARREPVIGV